jgi:hypothetical protein
MAAALPTPVQQHGRVAEAASPASRRVLVVLVRGSWATIVVLVVLALLDDDPL